MIGKSERGCTYLPRSQRLVTRRRESGSEQNTDDVTAQKRVGVATKQLGALTHVQFAARNEGKVSQCVSESLVAQAGQAMIGRANASNVNVMITTKYE
jgi:hypothetical protein